MPKWTKMEKDFRGGGRDSLGKRDGIEDRLLSFIIALLSNWRSNSIDT